MAETNDEPTTDSAQTQGTPTVSNAPFLTGTYNGQSVAWETEEEAREAAQRGLNYDSRMERLNEERAQHADSLRQLPEFQNFMERMNSSDSRRALYQRVYGAENPEELLARLEADPVDTSDALEPVALKSNAEMSALKNQFELLQRSVRSSDMDRQATEMQSKLEGLAGNFNFLSGNSNTTARELAIEQAAAVMLKQPGTAPETAMMVAAERIRSIKEGEAKAELDRDRNQQQLRTQSPQEGIPSTATPKEVVRKKSDLRDGTAMDRLVKSDLYKNLMADRGL